jgi:hypothetical protein
MSKEMICGSIFSGGRGDVEIVPECAICDVISTPAAIAHTRKTHMM